MYGYEDFIQRMIKVLGSAAAIFFVGKQKTLESLYDVEQNEQVVLSEAVLLKLIIQKYMAVGDINTAENKLYEAIKRNPSADNIKIAEEFYLSLEDYDEDYLNKNNYTRQEATDGLEWLKGKYNVHPHGNLEDIINDSN